MNANMSCSDTGKGYVQVGEAFTASILREVLPEGLPLLLFIRSDMVPITLATKAVEQISASPMYGV